tara:strand:- start:1758 stop:1979 length:222 start_codon:yes stop_codon:yes gene_type:complete
MAGNRHKEKAFVPVAEAMEAVTRLTQGPAAKIGVVKEVLITDTGDCTCFHWKEGVLLFPTEKDMQRETWDKLS